MSKEKTGNSLRAPVELLSLLLAQPGTSPRVEQEFRPQAHHQTLLLPLKSLPVVFLSM